MRALLSTYGSHKSRGDVDPMTRLAAPLRAPGTEALVGQPVRPLMAGATPPPLAGEGRDALVTTGVTPAGVWL